MPPLTMEQRTTRFLEMAGSEKRIGVSEFARGKAWRKSLEETGCVEVTDRSDTVGLLLTPEYASELASYIQQLENELEQAQIEMIFELRRQYSAPKSGKELEDAALAEFNAREDSIREFLDGDQQ